MEIEVWKRYRTRGGRKVGPMRSDASFGEPAFIEAEGDGRGWSLSGRAIGVEHGADEDLIAEWTDGPVRTVTRREIVRGQYAGVDVGEQLEIPGCDNPDVPPVRKVAVAYAGFRSSAELKAAAAVLLELVGALDE